MCDEFGSSDSLDMNTEDLSGDIETTETFDEAPETIDFEANGILDAPQEALEGVKESLDEDIYEAKTLDEIMILEENGDTHSIAERMEELAHQEQLENQQYENMEPYETRTLDETMILEEGGGVHSIAERMAELEESSDMRENLTGEQENLEPTIEGKINNLSDLREALLSGDQNALELFGLEDPNADADEGGFQKVKTR